LEASSLFPWRKKDEGREKKREGNVILRERRRVRGEPTINHGVVWVWTFIFCFERTSPQKEEEGKKRGDASPYPRPLEG